jgi:hypothetical protein
MVPRNQSVSVGLSATATIPESQQSKMAVLNTLASQHSRRSYEHAIDRFIAWYPPNDTIATGLMLLDKRLPRSRIRTSLTE